MDYIRKYPNSKCFQVLASLIEKDETGKLRKKSFRFLHNYRNFCKVCESLPDKEFHWALTAYYHQIMESIRIDDSYAYGCIKECIRTIKNEHLSRRNIEL